MAEEDGVARGLGEEAIPFILERLEDFPSVRFENGEVAQPGTLGLKKAPGVLAEGRTAAVYQESWGIAWVG